MLTLINIISSFPKKLEYTFFLDTRYISIQRIRFSFAQLWRDITRRAHHGEGFTLAAQHLGDTKIPNLDDVPVLVEQDVLRLEIPVKYLLGVDVLEGEQDLHE